ncbi:MAG TPA: hypothetical protein DCR94_03040 [Firmicutes bacterium]|nr:hypothetical protein [Bacillota bacterium]
MLIQVCIAKGEPAKLIAERIGLSASTVCKKIKRGSKTRNLGAGKCAKIGRIGTCNFCSRPTADWKSVFTTTRTQARNRKGEEARRGRVQGFLANALPNWIPFPGK